MSTFFREANAVNLHAHIEEALISKSFVGSSEEASHAPFFFQESPLLTVEMFFFNVICLECQNSTSWGKLMTFCLQGIKSLTQTLMPLCPPPVSKNPQWQYLYHHITIPIAIPCNSIKTMIATLQGKG